VVLGLYCEVDADESNTHDGPTEAQVEELQQQIRALNDQITQGATKAGNQATEATKILNQQTAQFEATRTEYEKSYQRQMLEEFDIQIRKCEFIFQAPHRPIEALPRLW